ECNGTGYIQLDGCLLEHHPLIQAFDDRNTLKSQYLLRHQHPPLSMASRLLSLNVRSTRTYGDEQSQLHGITSMRGISDLIFSMFYRFHPLLASLFPLTLDLLWTHSQSLLLYLQG